jgi:phosphoribosyl-AMP cyclohydrolase
MQTLQLDIPKRGMPVTIVTWFLGSGKRHFSIKSSKIVSTGEIHYWSRSRQELWHKGATSGHIQKLKKLYYDCDRDVILVKIEQVGDIACHTGARSCFFTEVPI